jgi:hypothetical protein
MSVPDTSNINSRRTIGGTAPELSRDIEIGRWADYVDENSRRQQIKNKGILGKNFTVTTKLSVIGGRTSDTFNLDSDGDSVHGGYTSSAGSQRGITKPQRLRVFRNEVLQTGAEG